MSRAPPLAPGFGQFDLGGIGGEHAVADAAVEHVAVARRLVADRKAHARQEMALAVHGRTVGGVGVDHLDIGSLHEAGHPAQQQHLGPFARGVELAQPALDVAAHTVDAAPFERAAHRAVFLVVDAALAGRCLEFIVRARIRVRACGLGVEVEAPAHLAFHPGEGRPAEQIGLRADVGGVARSERGGVPAFGEFLPVRLEPQPRLLLGGQRGEEFVLEPRRQAMRAGVST